MDNNNIPNNDIIDLMLQLIEHIIILLNILVKKINKLNINN